MIEDMILLHVTVYMCVAKKPSVCCDAYCLTVERADGKGKLQSKLGGIFVICDVSNYPPGALVGRTPDIRGKGWIPNFLFSSGLKVGELTIRPD